jgi:hypothetical protein
MNKDIDFIENDEDEMEDSEDEEDSEPEADGETSLN